MFDFELSNDSELQGGDAERLLSQLYTIKAAFIELLNNRRPENQQRFDFAFQVGMVALQKTIDAVVKETNDVSWVHE